MAHYIAYKILPKLHCVIEYYSGELRLNDLIEYQKRVAVDEHYDASFNIISDFRESNIQAKTDDVVPFIDFVKKHRPVAKRQSAVITDTPFQFVVAELYKMHLGSLPMNVSVISTVDAAIQWVGLSINQKMIIENTIQELKNSRTFD
jgi:hypothetical protein